MSFYFQHPISAERSEPMLRTTADQVANHPHHTASRAWPPEFMTDRIIDATHPIVRLYVQEAGRALEKAETEHAALPDNAPWHVCTDKSVSRWKAERGGMLQPGDGWDNCMRHIESVLGLRPGQWNLSAVKAVFALAALSTIPFPETVAFWAFWAKNSWLDTIDLVDDALRSQPRLIKPPDSATWPSKTFAQCLVDSYRRRWMPTMSTLERKRARTDEDDDESAREAKRPRAGAAGFEVVDTETEVDIISIDEPHPPRQGTTRESSSKTPATFTIGATSQSAHVAPGLLVLARAAVWLSAPHAAADTLTLLAEAAEYVRSRDTTSRTIPAGLPSPEGTLVGTATPSENSTRVASPREAPEGQKSIELGKVAEKLAQSGKQPVRVSARIRDRARIAKARASGKR